MEWPVTCNLKVKHRPSGSPVTAHSLMGTLQIFILGAQRVPLFIPSLVLCHDVGNDCGRGTRPDCCVHCSVSKLLLTPCETRNAYVTKSALGRCYHPGVCFY